MANTRRYAEDLRAIGQVVEAKGISHFELRRLGSSYTLQPTTEGTHLTPRTLRWLRPLHTNPTTGFSIIGVPDLEKLSKTGRARRSKPGELTEFRSVSNILRTIGAYLDDSEFELIEFHKRPISITLLYRDKAGRDLKEDRAISSLYRLFLDLCGKRIHSNYRSSPLKADQFSMPTRR